jgi:MFS family permease
MNVRWNNNIRTGALAQSVLLASVGTSMANLALPAIGAEFGVTFADARWVVLSYLLATTLFSLVVGRFADVKGRQITLFLGAALFSASTLVAVFAFSFWVLVFARMFQGIGASALVVLPIVIATESAHPSKTGRAIGFLATMSAIGTASGPSIGGFLIASYGWRSVFVVMSAVAAINLVLLFKFFPIQGPIGAAKLGRSNLKASLVAVWMNSAMRNQLYYNLVVSTVMMATLIVGPFYLSQGLHLTPIYMGLIMSIGPVTSIIASQISGLAVDRYGAPAIVVLGLGQLLIGTVSFVLLPAQLGSVGFAISAALLSLGYQLFLSANSSSVMKSSSVDGRALASGALTLTRNLGLIVGTSALGGIFDFVTKHSGAGPTDSAAILHGLQITFAVAAGLLGLSLIFHLSNKQRSHNGTKFLRQVY